MIPREILKKIRLLELRTNGIVNETLVGKLPYSPKQLIRISCPMPDSQDFDVTMGSIDCEVYRIRPWRRHFGLVGQPRRQKKTLRIFGQTLQKDSKSVVESQSNTLVAIFVPTDGLVPVPFCVRIRNDLKRHFLAKRRWISAETSSMGVPRPGFLNASSARRSSSAICSSVRSSSKSPNSCHTKSAISCCSASGKLRICSRISALLMPLIYRTGGLAQARFSAARNMQHARRLP